MKPKGWICDSFRHGQSARGIKNSESIFTQKPNDETVSIVDTKEAWASVEELRDEYFYTKTDVERKHILTVANMLSNRAEIISKNENVSKKVRDEKKHVADVYRKFVDEHKNGNTAL